VVALAVLGSPTAVLAQNAASQGPEGSWLYTVTIPGSAGTFVFKGLEIYAAGGGYVEADQLSFMPTSVASAGHGAWQSTGRTGEGYFF
jgi:hypothetical protein